MTKSNDNLSDISLDAIVGAGTRVESSTANNSVAISEENDYASEERRIKNRGLSNDVDDRKKYASHIFWLTVGWLIAVVLIVVLSGLGWLTLDSKVILALIGSGSVNVLAFFGSVTGYLFPKHK